MPCFWAVEYPAFDYPVFDYPRCITFAGAALGLEVSAVRFSEWGSLGISGQKRPRRALLPGAPVTVYDEESALAQYILHAKLQRIQDEARWHSRCVIGGVGGEKISQDDGEWWLAILTQSALRVAYKSGGQGVRTPGRAPARSAVFVQTKFIPVADLIAVQYSLIESKVAFTSHEKQVVLFLPRGDFCPDDPDKTQLEDQRARMTNDLRIAELKSQLLLQRPDIVMEVLDVPGGKLTPRPQEPQQSGGVCGIWGCFASK